MFLNLILAALVQNLFFKRNSVGGHFVFFRGAGFLFFYKMFIEVKSIFNTCKPATGLRYLPQSIPALYIWEAEGKVNYSTKNFLRTAKRKCRYLSTGISFWATYCCLLPYGQTIVSLLILSHSFFGQLYGRTRSRFSKHVLAGDFAGSVSMSLDNLKVWHRNVEIAGSNHIGATWLFPFFDFYQHEHQLNSLEV